jgi:hypothetical protein
MKRQPLRALRANARQLLQVIDQTCQRLWITHAMKIGRLAD